MMKKLFTILFLSIAVFAKGQTPEQLYWQLLGGSSKMVTPYTYPDGFVCTALNSDACPYIYNVHAAGYDMPATQQDAVSTFVTGLQINSLYTKIIAMWLFIGGTAPTHAVEYFGKYNLTYGGTIVHNELGANWNAIGWGKTGLIPSSVLAIGNTHISYYSQTNKATGSVIDMGANGSNFNSSSMHLWISGAGAGQSIIDMWSTSQRLTVTGVSGTAGMYIANRTSTNNLTLYKNGTLLGTNTATNTGTLPTVDIYLGANNNNGNAGSQSDRGTSFASVGLGLTAAEASTFSTLVNNLQTALGRNKY